MAHIDVPLTRAGFGSTSRRDTWWVQPLVVFLALSTFICYANWAIFQGDHYRYGPYLSPFYSPEVIGNPATAWFERPSWMPVWVTAAMLILWAPGGFRLTCYYYRGAYYKAFWADPPSCAVGEPRKKYLGERSFPLILQNIHRYFLFISMGFIILLALDALHAFRFADGWGIGIGSLVLTANVVLLSLYVLGCHSFRHLIGGRNDRLSQSPLRSRAYDCVTCLNSKHMRWAWCSLFSVAFSDLYVRLCSMGVWTDWRIL